MVSKKVSRKVAAKEELLLLLPEIDRIFDSEPAVLRIDTEPVMIVGDIHGNLQALEYVIEKRE